MKVKFSSRDIALVAIFAGITAALGLIPPIATPFSTAPITAQSLGVMLAGSILGARKGAASQLLFLVLVAIGLPLLAGGRGGLGQFATHSVGFLIGFVVVAYLIGLATEKVGAPYRFLPGLIINIVGGLIVMYALGIIGMMLVTGMDLVAAIIAITPYLVGGAIKVVLAAAIAQGVHRSYPGLLPRRGKPSPVAQESEAK